MLESNGAAGYSRRTLLKQGCLSAAAIPLGLLGRQVEAASGPPRIKIGQIGVDHGHANKLQVYRNSPDYEVVGIVEPDLTLRQQAQKNPIFRELPFLTVDELLATPGLQAVLVETRIRDLLHNAERCVQAGMHVHIDKPAGASLEHFNRILNLAQQQKLFVQLGYMYRFNPGIVLLHQFLKEGWLGDLFEVHAVMSKVIDPPERKELAEFSGGTMFELGCHLIDLVIGILGRPESIVSFLKHSSTIEDGLQDNCQAILNYPRTTASVVSTAMEVEGFQRRHFVVCGTKGTFKIQPLDNPSAEITLASASGEFKQGIQTVTFPKFQRYVADAAEMAKAIRGELPFDGCYERERIVQTAILEASQMS